MECADTLSDEDIRSAICEFTGNTLSRSGADNCISTFRSVTKDLTLTSPKGHVLLILDKVWTRNGGCKINDCRKQTCTTFLISVFFNSTWGTKAKKSYLVIIKDRTHHFTKRCSPSGILLTCSVETLFWRQYNICPGSVCHPWLNPASLACRPCTTSMLNFPTSRNRRAPFYTRV